MLPRSMLTAGSAKTIDDLMALPPETRAELIGGEIIMSPAPDLRHQAAVGNLHVALHNFVRARRLGRVFVAPVDVFLSRTVVVEPDVCFIAAARATILKRRGIEGAPDLMVEVLSPSTSRRDRKVKRGLYEQHGVREYWIADPVDCTVEVLTLRDGVYVRHGIFESGEAVTSPVLPALRLAVDAVFE